MITNATKKELDRWYQLIPHPKQLELISDPHRFKVIPAGRRSGKTERFKRYVVKKALENPGMSYFAGAPTYTQAKRIFWSDLKLLSLTSLQSQRPSETELRIQFDNGASITIIGFDKPERFEGAFWAGGGIDEFGNLKPLAWPESIKPALDTFNPLMPDYRAWCWLFGVPEGINHYYDINQAAIDPLNVDWKSYTWYSSDILPADIIEEAKRTLSPKQYRQEYEASFETASGRVYGCFDKTLNNAPDVVQSGDEPLDIGMDFNVEHMSAIVHVERDRLPVACGEIVDVVDTPAMIKAIKNKYRNNRITVYPDASGDNRSTHDASKSDIKLLMDAGFKVRAATQNPRIKDRVLAMNSMFLNTLGERRYKVNIKECPKYVANLEMQVYTELGVPDKKSNVDHTNDAAGYFIDTKYGIIRPSTGVNRMTGI